MPDIVPARGFSISEQLKELDLYKYHSNGILNVALTRLSDMLDGKIEISDPANPFTYLLETSCLNTAFAIQEHTLLARKLYPRLTNNEKDLYLHMSDYDYLGVFAEPAYGNVIFNILLNDFQTKATYDPVQREHVLKLPRHLKISIDKYIFTLTSAIIIRLTETGVVDVKFENQDFNNIFPVETNFINFNIYKVNQEETYINFSVKLPEVDIEPVEIPVEKSKLFSNTLTFNPARKFYFFRAFYMLDGKWSEMIVTHTNEVYDIYKPTCIIKVLPTENSIEYYIPPVYVNTNKIGSKVKFLIYTTNGNITVNFNDFLIGDFSSEYNPVFPDQELDATTESLHLISKAIFIKDKISGGKNDLPFSYIKESVIQNSIGDRQLPITNKQKEFSIEQKNFKLIKDVDTVTNRIFLLELNIPRAATRYPVTRINTDVINYKTTISELKLNGNNVVDISPNITLIPEKTVFNITKDGLKILSRQEYSALVSMSGNGLTNQVNTNTYVSTMFHYVLDTSENESELRAYNVSSPTVKQINFKEFNSTARVGVNTTNISIAKTAQGYVMNILANFKKYVDNINHTNVTPYLVYTDINKSRFYLPAKLFTEINENPVYKFIIDTNFYIDKNGNISVSNFKDANNNTVTISINLNAPVKILYLTNITPPEYVSSEMDNYILNSYLAIDRRVVTLEEVTVNFYTYLEHLYSRIHTSTGTYNYQRYTENIPLRHTANVYNSLNAIVHRVNDVVIDSVTNEVVFKHKIGDVILDANNNPIPINQLELVRYLSLLFMDYRAQLATNVNIVNYRNFIKSFIYTNVTENAVEVQKDLLENTKAFVVVPGNINVTTAITPTRIVNISCLQSFIVDVYVTPAVYSDNTIRDNITHTVMDQTEEYLMTNTTYTRTALLNILYTKLKDYTKNISIRKFTELNDEIIELQNKNHRLTINKLLTVEPDGYNLAEDVQINFISV